MRVLAFPTPSEDASDIHRSVSIVKKVLINRVLVADIAANTRLIMRGYDRRIAVFSWGNRSCGY
jgi:hypothetical protein